MRLIVLDGEGVGLADVLVVSEALNDKHQRPFPCKLRHKFSAHEGIDADGALQRVNPARNE